MTLKGKPFTNQRFVRFDLGAPRSGFATALRTASATAASNRTPNPSRTDE
jgi:hypothetical protein